MSIKLIAPSLWRLDIRIWDDGREYRHRESFPGGKKAAEERALEIKKELRLEAKNGRGSLTNRAECFQNIIDYYLERVQIDKDSKTYLEKMKSDLGTVPIRELRDRFDTYLLQLRKSKCKNSGRTLTNGTVNKYIAWGKAALNYALRAGLIEKNPLEHFRKLPTIPRDRMLSEDEKSKLLSKVEKEAPHLFPIVQFALLVPSRRGELLKLRKENLDLFNNVIRIEAEMTKKKRPVIKPIPPQMTEYFRKLPPECDYLFFRRNWKGEYLPLGDFRGSLKRCLELAEIKDWHFHDSRRGSYTDLLLAGNAPHTVMQISGHATDMSRVYFGRNELLAAKSARFKTDPKPEKKRKTGHLDRTLEAKAF